MPASAVLSAERVISERSCPPAPVRLVNPLATPDWDAQVSKFSGFSFFHTAAWARVLNQTYGFTPLYLTSATNGSLDAALPVMEVNSWLTGKRGVSLPFTDRCEPLGAGNNSTLPLFEQAVELGRSRGWKFFECRGSRSLDELTEFAQAPKRTVPLDCGSADLPPNRELGRTGLPANGELGRADLPANGELGRADLPVGSQPGSAPPLVGPHTPPRVPTGAGHSRARTFPSERPRPSLSFFGHRLELSSDTAQLIAQCDSSTRRAIRKAEKSALTVEVSNSLSAVREYYALHCLTRQRHGLPPQPLKFFLNIHRFILSQNLGMVVFAKKQQRTVASAIFFHTEAELLYKFGASDPAYQELRPNNLVMWTAIHWAARQGRRVLDFGRTSLSNEGLRRFKLGWGAAEQRIDYFKYDLHHNRFVTDKDETSGRHVALFRVLPVFVSRLIGATLYKHIA